MAEEQVQGYQRKSKTGKIVRVKEYSRNQNEVVTEHVLNVPGRPPMAATPGQFAGGRFLPNHFPPVINPNKPRTDADDPLINKTDDPLKNTSKRK